MPYTNQSKSDYYDLQVLLTGSLHANKKSYKQLAADLNVSAPTERKLRQHPEKLTLEEVNKIRRILHISVDDIRAKAIF